MSEKATGEKARFLALYLLINGRPGALSDEEKWIDELVKWDLLTRLRTHEGSYSDCLAVSFDGARLLLKYAGEF